MTKFTRFIVAVVVFTFAIGMLRAQSIYEPYTFGTLAGLALNSGTNDNTGSLARFNQPWGLAVDGSGNVYVADTLNQTIRKITPAGVVTTLAGVAGSAGFNDGASATALFSRPTGVAVNGAGTVVFVADYNNHLIRQISGGVVSTLAGSIGVAGTNDATGTAAQFHNPFGVTLNSAGTVLYVADQNNQTIRAITIPGGVVTTLAGAPGINGSTDDPANNLNARFNTPRGIAVDSSGNVFVADAGNFTVRKIAAGGGVSTLAGSVFTSGFNDGSGSNALFSLLSAMSPFGGPCGVAVDGSGNVYVTDQGNHTIRKITSGGSVTTLAGLAQATGSADGNGSVARFNFPAGVAVDGAGNLYVADTVNHTVRTGVKTNCVQMISATNKIVVCGSAWDFDAPTNIVDNCCTNFSLTFSTVTNGLCPPMITRTWVVGDLCGNTNTCSQTVTVIDTTPPTLACSTNKTVQCGSAWSFDPPTGVDACSGTNVTVGILNTVTNGLCPLVITRIWLASDLCGNTNTCSQTVTVAPSLAFTSPNSPAVISGPIYNPTNGHVYYLLSENTWTASEAEAVGLGGHLATVRSQTENDWIYAQFSQFGGTNRGLWIGLNDTNSEGNFVWVSGEIPSPPYLNWASGEPMNQNGLDDYVHLFWPGDTAGRQSKWNDQWDIIGSDFGIPINGVVEVSNFPPPLTCATNKTVACGTAWTFDPPTATGSCSGINVTVGVLSTVTNGLCPQVITRTWLASDLCGNTNTCSQTVTVIDTTPPTLTCSTNKTVQCGSAWSFDPPTGVDACSGTNVTVGILNTVTNGLCPLVITRTWLASDLCGNTNTCSQTVTLLDSTPITISITGSNNIFGAGHTIPPNPGGGGAGTLPPSYGFPAGPGKVLTFASVTGTSTLTVCCASNGADGYYNIAPTDINSYGGISGIQHDGASFLVGVFLDDNMPSDPAPPILDFRTNAVGTSFNQLSPLIGQTFFIGDGLTGTGSGAVQQFVVPPTATRLFLGLADAPNYLGNPGAYEDNGGLLTATFQIKQTITCATNKTVECGSAWSFDPPTLWNGCSGTNNITVTFSTVTNGICPQIITRTWRAVDLCGNTNTCSQAVTVVDTTPPVFGCANPSVTVFSAGTTNDNFAGPEPAFPSAGLLLRLHNAGVSNFKGFDDCVINTFFAHTFTNLPSCITGATLHIRFKGCGSNYDYDDTLSLGFTATNGSTMPPSWGRYVGYGTGNPGLLTGWYNSSIADLVLDLSQLPNADGSTTDLIPTLNAQGFLDIIQQDDSSIDFAVLTVTSSCCGITNKTVPCGTAWSFDAPTATDNCSGTNVTVGILTTVTNGLNTQIITRTWLASDLCGNTNIYSQTVMIQCPSNACVAAPTNMVLWLPFDETNGITSANYVAGGNSGTQFGGPIVTSGYVDHSLNFNGVNQYVEVPSYNAINFGTNDFSIDAWVKRATNDLGDSSRVIVDKRALSGSLYQFTVTGYLLGLGTGGTLVFQLADGNLSTYTSSLAVPNDGNWHHVAVTVARHNTSGLVFYLDGAADSVVQNPVPRSGSVSSTAALRVGSLSFSVSFNFFGGIDEVELFNRALAPAEIATLFNAGAAGKCKNPCAIPLIIHCPTNKMVDCGSTNWSFDPPTATGIGVTVTSTGFVTNSSVCPKSITQNWLVQDTCGNKNTCSQTVTLVDTTPPSIIPPASTFPVALDTNCNLVIPPFKKPVSWDNCTPQNLLTNFTQFPPAGTIISNSHSQLVTLRVTDACGNSTNCQVMVLGYGPKPQFVSWPTNGVTATNCLVPNVLKQVFATQACTASNQLIYTQSPTNGTPIAAGVSGITVTVTDPANSNNTASVFIPITGQQSFLNAMFNTGINSSHATVPAGLAAVDLHYFLGLVPAGTPTGAGYYFAPKAIVPKPWPWGLISPASRWIDPGTNASGSYPNGTYIYTNQFTLPAGADPASAAIQGRWAADDVAAMYFNGLSSANKVPFPVTGTGYNHWTPFSINTGFIPGVNTLYCIVTNTGGGPTGLRVEFTSAQINCSTCAPPSLSLSSLQIAWFTRSVGGSVTFHAAILGTPPLTMQWLHNGQPLASGVHYPGGVNASSLTVANIVTADAGTYSIVISNACGSYTSSIGTLNVSKGWGWGWGWWHFAVIGNPLKADFGPDLVLNGMNTLGISSGTTDDYGLPGIGGQMANVMDVPPLPGDTYIQMPFIPPTSGDSVSNYTLITDVYLTADATNPATLFELSNPAMGGQVRLSTGAIAGIVIGGATYLNVDCTIGGLPVSLVSTMPLPLGQWNRVALVVEDMSLDMDSSQIILTLYLNGMGVGRTSFNASAGALAFTPGSLATLLSSPEGTAGEAFVSSIQFHDMALAPETMASIGNPANGPIPANNPSIGKPPVLSVNALNGMVNFTWSGSAYRLQESADLTSGVWVDSPLPFDQAMDVAGNITTTVHASPPFNGPARFYRLLYSP